MTRDLFTLGLGIAAILLTVQGARADTLTCIERATLMTRLAELYGESRQMVGLAGPDGIVEVFASPETGSWTLIVTRPDGIACLLAAGTAFERVDAAPARLGDPV